jgi:NADH-quinone oxidoreductase subunit D
MAIETAPLRTEPFELNMGPQHPSTHGVFRMILTMDGEKVVDARPEIGFLHRSMEKMAENRQYIQFLPMTDRIDYLSSAFCGVAHCEAVERLMGLEVPPRAKYLRTLFMEINRIASHLIFWGIFGLDLGAVTAFLYGFRERELCMDLLEMISGQRMTFNYIRFGGVAADLPKEFDKYVRDFLKVFPEKVTDYERLLNENEIFKVRTKGVGQTTAARAVNYGWTGPNLRSCGVDFDLRRDLPYEAYGDLGYQPVVLANGDCYDRFLARVLEMRASCELIRKCVDGLPEGPIQLEKVSKYPKVPAGEVYVRVESPRGEYGLHLISDGGTKPYRYKLRTPSFANLQMIRELVRGVYFADIVPIFGSLDVILPDVDR